MPIEWVMYIAIVFLLAGLVCVVLGSLIHHRAVRLTTRLEAALPQSLAEIQTDKELLRSEFAMSTRVLQDIVEQLKIELVALKVEVNALKTRPEVTTYSTKMIEHASLVPVAPTTSQSPLEDRWTCSDGEDQLAQKDTWARGELMSDTSVIPSVSQHTSDDTWTRDVGESEAPLQLDSACRGHGNSGLVGMIAISHTSARHNKAAPSKKSRVRQWSASKKK